MNRLIRHNFRSECASTFACIGLRIPGRAGGDTDDSLARLVRVMVCDDRIGLCAAGAGVALVATARHHVFDRQRSINARQVAQPALPACADGRLLLRQLWFCGERDFIVAIVNHLPGLTGWGNLVFLAIGIGAAPACINWGFIARHTGDLNALILEAVL